MKATKFFFLMVTILFLDSCKKAEIIEPVVGTPLFFAQINIDGVQKQLEAGRNSFYQYANFYLDTNDVYVFKSLLGKDDLCTNNCQESLQIEIRNNTISNGQLPDLAQALRIGTYPFAQADDTLTTNYQYIFLGSLVGTNQVLQKEYKWHFSSEIDTSTLNLTSEQISFQLPNTIPFEATLSVTDAYGAKGSKLMHILPNSFTGISMNITGNASNPVVVASVDLSSNAITNFNWDSGITTSEQALSPSHPYGTYCASGKDTTGHIATTCGEYTQLFGQNIFCTAQIQLTKEEIVLFDQHWLATINITYTDASGKKWTSFDTSQQNSNFEITDIKEYKTNEDGFQTKLISAKFNAIITNNTNTKKINGTTVFAVGIPN